MTEIDTEFEENSFDDEFGPEDEESVPVDKKLRKKAKALNRRADVAGNVPGAPGSTSKLVAMMQEDLRLNPMPEITIPLRSRNICPKPMHPQTSKPTAPRPAPVNPARAAAHADALSRLAAAASASNIASTSARLAAATASQAVAVANAAAAHAAVVAVGSRDNQGSSASAHAGFSEGDASTDGDFSARGGAYAIGGALPTDESSAMDVFSTFDEYSTGGGASGNGGATGAVGRSSAIGGASNIREDLDMDDEPIDGMGETNDGQSAMSAVSSAIAVAQSSSAAVSNANAVAEAASANLAAAYAGLAAAASGLATSPSASAAMAALADLTGYTDGSIATTSADGTYGPRPLKLLTAEILIRQTGKFSLHKLNVPSYLYPTLLTESARLASEESIVHLVSTWPFPILNLAELRIPIEGFIQTLPQSVSEDEDDSCLADSFVRGLFYRKRKFCRLQMIVLPKDTSAGSDMLRYFARIPLHYVRSLPNFKIADHLGMAKLKDAETYVEKVPHLDLKREINFYAYTKDSVRVVIAMPNAVIHFLGHKSNFNDVHAGLALQRHCPFEFHFDNIAIINYVSTKAVVKILDNIVRPENVKKLLIKNKRVFRPDHIVYMIPSLQDTLSRFTGLVGLFTKISAVMTYVIPEPYNIGQAKDKLRKIYTALPNLTKINFNDQPLEGHFPTLFNPIVSNLTKLSLVRCHLRPEDITCLAQSRHVYTLKYLKLDHNDLHVAAPQMLDLLTRLRSIERLSMQSCMLKFKDCLRAAEAIKLSRTLRRWSMIDNVMFKLHYIRDFLVLCSKVPTLREVGIKPLDFHILMDQVVVHSRKAYSEDKKQELYLIAAELNLIVF